MILKSNNNFYGWLGTITGIIGGTMIAMNSELSKFGYIFFIMSAISWIIQGLRNKDNSLVLLNSFFICINILGVYHWFF
jgi:nicotinamide riboside transporter PnuC